MSRFRMVSWAALLPCVVVNIEICVRGLIFLCFFTDKEYPTKPPKCMFYAILFFRIIKWM